MVVSGEHDPALAALVDLSRDPRRHAVAGQQLDRGILYAPDYCVNSGGLIQVADELEGFSFDRAQQRATGIFDTTRSVFELARADGVPPAIAADRLAERRMRDVGRLRGVWLP